MKVMSNRIAVWKRHGTNFFGEIQGVDRQGIKDLEDLCREGAARVGDTEDIRSFEERYIETATFRVSVRYKAVKNHMFVAELRYLKKKAAILQHTIKQFEDRRASDRRAQKETSANVRMLDGSRKKVSALCTVVV